MGLFMVRFSQSNYSIYLFKIAYFDGAQERKMYFIRSFVENIESMDIAQTAQITHRREILEDREFPSF